MIDRETVERIKDAADIVDVVSDYVHLTRRGANYMGLCPFHNERTPSFSVNKSRNFCYCFSCHKGGSPVNFIMEKEGLSYHDALLHLARKYNIEVQEREISDEERTARNEREAMAVANEWAAKEMSSNLLETAEGKNVGLSYLYGRGVTAEAISQFRLGYAIDRGDALSEKARRAGFDIGVLLSLGLLGKSQQGHTYDKFRGRVIFPIINPSGRVVGFGGRDLKGGPAKYINSPESAIYSKSNELYGIYQAKGEIVRQDKCYLVEGYLDVIGMWQAGIKNVVASSGTALTDSQIALIHRFTNKITVLYDGDKAGIKAALRGIDMLLRQHMEVKVLLLPDGHDPDSFARSLKADDFRAYIEEHETDIIRFQTQVLLDEAGQDPQKRIAAANAVVRSISAIPDKLARRVYTQECAKIFGLDEETVFKAVEHTMQESERQYQREKEKEQRRREAAKRAEEEGISRSAVDSGISPQAQEEARQIQNPGLEAAGVNKTASVAERRQPFLEGIEREIMKICVRHGYSIFYDYVDEESGEREVCNMVHYIMGELEVDGLGFSTPAYDEIVKALLEGEEKFQRDCNRFLAEIHHETEEMRAHRREELASSVISMERLQIEEQRMDEEFTRYSAERLQDYACDYTVRFLTSHENNIVRRTATELLYDRNQMSKRFTKSLRPEELRQREEESLQTRILVWLNNIKYEVFNQRIDAITEEFRQSQLAGRDPEKERWFMTQMVQLNEQRKHYARLLGDRVISPRKR